jgi:beta-barrel assembly-enhancing protease
MTCGPARTASALIVVLLLVTAARSAASPSPQLEGVLKRAQQVRELTITRDDEIRLGEAVSEKVRRRYGVVQDQAVHTYVGTLALLLAQNSTRPDLPWRVIVLDTDGVNAFAAPGGFIHITKGALALMKNEAELAGVLAHEIIHVTEKHTINAIKKNKAIQMGAEETNAANSKIFSQLVDRTTELVMAGFGRNEELESDRLGVVLADKVGYAPTGLSAFLTRLAERNKGTLGKQGLYASHPEMQERLDKIAKQIATQHLDATALVATRFARTITYKPKAITEVATVEAGSAGLAGGGTDTKSDKDKDPKTADQTKKRGFGLGTLLKPGGDDKKSAEVVGSGASRGVDTERGAKGGPVKTPVEVKITAADIAAFKKGIR